MPKGKKLTDRALGPDRIVKEDFNKRRWYFQGEGKYKPEAVQAETLKEATAIYEKIRRPLNNS